MLCLLVLFSFFCSGALDTSGWCYVGTDTLNANRLRAILHGDDFKSKDCYPQYEAQQSVPCMNGTFSETPKCVKRPDSCDLSTTCTGDRENAVGNGEQLGDWVCLGPHQLNSTDSTPAYCVNGKIFPHVVCINKDTGERAPCSYDQNPNPGHGTRRRHDPAEHDPAEESVETTTPGHGTRRRNAPAQLVSKPSAETTEPAQTTQQSPPSSQCFWECESHRFMWMPMVIFACACLLLCLRLT